MKGRRTRRLVTQVLAVALSAAALLTLHGGVASADGYGWPGHDSGAIGCESYLYFTPRTVSAAFPLRFNGNNASYERVSWKPDLQWWNASYKVWVTINTDMPWVTTWANNLGMYGYPADFKKTWYPYQPGYYRIINWYHWSSTGQMHYMYSGSCEAR